MNVNNSYKSISQSSILNLKAELFKKKASIQQVSNANLNQDLYFSVKPKVSPSPVEEAQIPPPKKSGPPLEKPLNEKIKLSLNMKAEKYRKLLLKSTYEDYEPLEEDSLVDFSRMPVEDTEKLLSRLIREEENNEEVIHSQGPQHILTFDDPLEEVIDEFGRTRMVPRHEAIRIKHEQDVHGNSPIPLSMSPMVQDEYKPVQNAHYSEDFEIRTKSVFFYRFSANEDMRQEQMKALRALESLSDTQRAAVQQAKRLDLHRRANRKEIILSKRQEFISLMCVHPLTEV